MPASSSGSARVYVENRTMDAARRLVVAVDPALARVQSDTDLVRWVMQRGLDAIRSTLPAAPPLVGRLLTVEQAVDLARAGVPHYTLVTRLNPADIERFNAEVGG